MIQRPALHVLGCAPASGNPGEPCSGYLVSAGGSRILLDCGPGVLSSLLARDAAPLDAIVLSHLHFDHVADLIPLGFAHVFGLASEWKPPALYRAARRRGAADGAVRGERSRRQSPHGMRADGRRVRPWRAALAIGDAHLTFRELIHPGVSHAIRVEAGGGALVYSGDTAVTPALGEHAAGADLLLTESTALPSSAGPPARRRCGPHRPRGRLQGARADAPRRARAGGGPAPGARGVRRARAGGHSGPASSPV